MPLQLRVPVHFCHCLPPLTCHSLQLCVPVPLYHCFGIVMGVFAAINCGAGIVFPAPAFDAEVWEALRPRCD
jgi:acyl-CoA synthetase (AMP-forming)/AMP-acid ligase II